MHSITSPAAAYRTARNIKMPAIYPKMADAGAVFDQFGVYERAIYYRDPLTGY